MVSGWEATVGLEGFQQVACPNGRLAHLSQMRAEVRGCAIFLFGEVIHSGGRKFRQSLKTFAFQALVPLLFHLADSCPEVVMVSSAAWLWWQGEPGVERAHLQGGLEDVTRRQRNRAAILDPCRQEGPHWPADREKERTPSQRWSWLLELHWLQTPPPPHTPKVSPAFRSLCCPFPEPGVQTMSCTGHLLSPCPSPGVPHVQFPQGSTGWPWSPGVVTRSLCRPLA